MLTQPQVSCDVRHIFGPGLYVREITFPADTFAIGHWQKHEHLNVMLKGRATVMNDDGSTTTLVAPMTFIGKPGRKVGYIHETVIWLNIYSTTETDVEKLEATYLDKSPTYQLSQKLLDLKPGGDYQKLLSELGVTEEIVRAQSENDDDQIPFPSGSYKIKVGRSQIEGRGIIATADIAAGEFIAPARMGGKRTPAGRFTNHAREPNARMVPSDSGDINLMSSRNIRGCRGGQDGEEVTIDYRQSLKVNLRLIK